MWARGLTTLFISFLFSSRLSCSTFTPLREMGKAANKRTSSNTPSKKEAKQETTVYDDDEVDEVEDAYPPTA